MKSRRLVPRHENTRNDSKRHARGAYEAVFGATKKIASDPNGEQPCPNDSAELFLPSPWTRTGVNTPQHVITNKQPLFYT